MLMIASSCAQLHQQLPPRSQRAMLDLCIYRIIFISVVLHSARQNKVKRSWEVSSHQLNVSLCEREDMSYPDPEICCHSLRYLPHKMSWKVNKHIQMEGVCACVWGGNRWKQELFCIRPVFMLSLWHQERLAMASSALRVVTSNRLLRASQGDYLCTISGSLWSLCDNSILS